MLDKYSKEKENLSVFLLIMNIVYAVSFVVRTNTKNRNLKCG